MSGFLGSTQRACEARLSTRGVLAAQVREANQMVEEMMLLANCTVAEQTLRHFPALSLLRRHPTPPPKHFEPLLRAAAAVGLSIDPATSKVGGKCW